MCQLSGVEQTNSEGCLSSALKVCQENDPSLSTIINLLSKNLCPSDQHLSQRYTQIWIQLKLIDDLLCREYDMEGFGVTRNVIVGSNELKETFLYHHQDGEKLWRNLKG